MNNENPKCDLKFPMRKWNFREGWVTYYSLEEVYAEFLYFALTGKSGGRFNCRKESNG